MSAAHTHTPGPWVADCRDVNYKGGEWPENEFLQWEVVGPRVPSGRGEFFQADARLIAAAPELLAALKSCAAVCAGETLNKSALVNALEQARAAIAKAEQT
jgi:hypothetical protein